MAIFIRNPFLQGGHSENNLTQVASSNNPDTTPNVLDEKISIDNVPNETNLYVDTKTKSELSKCI